MGGCRENANIWSSLGFCSYGGKWHWRGKRLFTKSFWGSPYLLHDSFGAYFNRFIICKLLGHREVKDVSDPGEEKRMHCFKCEKHLK